MAVDRTGESRVVRVAAARLPRWLEGFAATHGALTHGVHDRGVLVTAADGSWAHLRAPFGRSVEPGNDPVESVLTACDAPPAWGVLLVRKGGFAVARLAGRDVTASKVGRRHVQGRTKAGGQSQQRFARRRDNQARVAYEAAAEHAVAVLGVGPLDALVTGGDRNAVEAVLADPRLRRAAAVRFDDWLATSGDPRRDELDAAVQAAQAVRVRVHNAAGVTRP